MPVFRYLGNEAVGIAQFDQHGAEIDFVGDDSGGLFRCHPLFFSKIVAGLCEFFEFRVIFRVDNVKLRRIGAPLRQALLDGWDVSQQNQFRKPEFKDFHGGVKGTLI